MALAGCAVALVTSGGAAATGVIALPDQPGSPPVTAELSAATATATATPTTTAAAPTTSPALRSRGEGEASRSDRRADVDPREPARLADESRSGGRKSRTEEPGGGDPRTIAQALMPQFGFSSDQFGCLDALWTKESGWNVHADNPTSSAYGIPQALPGSKMASAGADWVDNPATQIRWGLGYIRAVYGSPCGAWEHSQAVNWY